MTTNNVSGLSGGAAVAALSGARVFTDCNFEDARVLSETRSSGSTFQHCNFDYMLASDWTSAASSFTRCRAVGAILNNCELSGAIFEDCDLKHISFLDVNLERAVFKRCDLTAALFERSNLGGAEITDCITRDMNCDASINALKNIDELRGARDLSGELIVWKKCLNEVIVKLRVPADARRSRAFGNKCRAERVEVLEITKRGERVARARSIFYDTIYEVGRVVECHEWCDDWTQECAGGIHFFLTLDEAAEY